MGRRVSVCVRACVCVRTQRGMQSCRQTQASHNRHTQTQRWPHTQTLKRRGRAIRHDVTSSDDRFMFCFDSRSNGGSAAARFCCLHMKSVAVQRFCIHLAVVSETLPLAAAKDRRPFRRADSLELPQRRPGCGCCLQSTAK